MFSSYSLRSANYSFVGADFGILGATGHPKRAYPHCFR